jgi:hypothetical protein
MDYNIDTYLEKGENVESKFAKDCDEFVRAATRSEDFYRHWDVIVKINNEKMKVDVIEAGFPAASPTRKST